MGEYLSQPNKKKEVETGENQKVKFVAMGMQGWRRSMEDSHIAHLSLDGGNQLFGVFDGHGGQETALFVKKHMGAELQKLQSYKSGNYRQALEDCFYKMDDMMLTPAGKKELEAFNADSTGVSYAGCTATVVLIAGKEIYCANAGDSRTVLSSAGQAIEMSKDHKPDDHGEACRIHAAGGFVEEGRVNGMLALSRALGDFEYKQNKNIAQKDQAVSAFPDVKVQELNNQTEFIVLACDGIWDVMTSQDVVDFCHKEIYNNKFGKVTRKISDLQSGMEKMMDFCCATDLASSQGLGCDNMTAIIVELQKQ